jgi:cytochrome P450
MTTTLSSVTAPTAPALPPGPRFPAAFVKLLQWSPVMIRTDVLKFNVDVMRQYGTFAAVVLGPTTIYTITDPELVHEMAVTRADEFHKGPLVRDATGWLVGNGLLLSEGDLWKRQRKLAQPAFHHKRIEAYATVMVDYARQLADSWQNRPVIDLFHEMSKFTLRIVNKTLFNVEIAAEVDHTGRLMTTLLSAANDKLYSLDTFADKIAFLKHYRERKALAELRTIITNIIDAHRQQGEDTGDLLSMLIQARDEEGKPMDAQQLHDEVLTLFVAGHETSANALTWAFYLLAQHPEVEAKLREEITRVVGTRPPTLADLMQMPYIEMVTKETMRLYPPAGGFSRTPLHDIQFGGYSVPKGSNMAVSTYAMHRHEKFFPQPEVFDPERFSKEREASIPKHAYLPFGSGPRVCIGNSFATMEIRLGLIAIMQRYRLVMADNKPVQAEQVFTIRPKRAVRMRIMPA